MTDSELIQNFVARRSIQGWQVISQSPDSVQMKRPKQWSKLGLIIGFVLLLLYGAGLLILLLTAIDYAIQSEQTVYVTAEMLRKGNEPPLPTRSKGPLIMAGVLLGGATLCFIYFLATNGVIF